MLRAVRYPVKQKGGDQSSQRDDTEITSKLCTFKKSMLFSRFSFQILVYTEDVILFIQELLAGLRPNKSRRKPPPPRDSTEDKGLQASEGKFRGGVLYVKPLVKAPVETKRRGGDRSLDRVFSDGKGRKGGGKKGKGKGKGKGGGKKGGGKRKR